MELTAEAATNKQQLVVAAPIEYDHFGFTNPDQNYLNSKNKVQSIRPQTAFLRADVLDSTETFTYLHKTKSIWQDKLLQVPQSFKPKIVSSSFFASQVVNTLANHVAGGDMIVRGGR